MKQGIHPTYYPDAKVTCASCGTTWTTGSTKKEIRVEICSNCHPFFSGESARMIDIEGQVDRFYKKLQAHEDFVEEQKSREAQRTSPELPVAELELGTRAETALRKAGIENAGQALARLAQGEAALLAIDGFGRKSLADLKRRLRQRGFELPEAAAEPQVE